MGLFDGETFRGIDEALTGADEPLDTLLEHEVRNQTYHLAINRGNRACLALSTRAMARTAFEGEKAYASSAWTAIVDVPWYAGAGLERIAARLWARVSRSGADSASATISVRLEVVGFGHTDHELAYDGGLYRDYGLEHVLTRAVRTARLTRLRIWIWSRASDTITAVSDVEAFVTPLADGRPSRRCALIVDPTYIPLPTLPAPNTTSRGEVRMVWREGDDGEDRVSDILWRERTAFFPVFRELHCAEPPVTASRNAQWRYQQLSYVQVKSVEIEERFATPTVIPSQSIRAQMPVMGQDEIRHVALARSVFARPRCLALGPVARTPRISTELGGVIPTTIYPERWVWSSDVEDPDAPGDEGEVQNVWSASLTLDDPGGQIVVQASILPYVLMSAPQWQAVDGQPLADVRTLATWEITGRLVWWDGAAFEVIAEQILTPQITHIPTRINDPQPILTAAWARDQTELPNEAAYYKEGQMYAADLPLIQPLTLALAAPTDPSLIGIPLHLTLEAQRLTIDDQPEGVDVSGRPQLIWTGHSAWQVRS